jgi:hypothetical protein
MVAGGAEVAALAGEGEAKCDGRKRRNDESLWLNVWVGLAETVAACP